MKRIQVSRMAYFLSPLYLILPAIKTRLIDVLRVLSGRQRPKFTPELPSKIISFFDGPLFDPLGVKGYSKAIHGLPGSGLHPKCRAVDLRRIAGQTFELEIDPVHSYIGDCVHICDQPNSPQIDSRLPPFSDPKVHMFGSNAIVMSQISGTLQVIFDSEAHEDGALLGCEFRMVRPIKVTDSALVGQEYFLAAKKGKLTSSPFASKAQLELATGRLFDLNLNLDFTNSAIEAVLARNKYLPRLPLFFPGVGYSGHAIGHFTANESDVDLDLHCSQYLPLDEHRNRQHIRLPDRASHDTPDASVLARNSALHPVLRVSATSYTKQSHPALTAEVIGQPSHRTHTLELIPRLSRFGDRFELKGYKYGQIATGFSPLMGQVLVQTTELDENSSNLGFEVSALEPHRSFSRRLAGVIPYLPPFTRPGLIGMKGEVDFPRQSLSQRDLGLLFDSQKLTVGKLNRRDNLSVGQVVLRAYFYLDLLKAVMSVEPRTPTDSFAFVSDVEFTEEEAGARLTLCGKSHIPYPEGYFFPTKFGRSRIGAGSYLEPFVSISAVECASFLAVTVSEFEFVPRDISRGTKEIEYLRLESDGKLSICSSGRHETYSILSSRQATAPDGWKEVKINTRNGKRDLLVFVSLHDDRDLVVNIFSSDQKLDVSAVGPGALETSA